MRHDWTVDEIEQLFDLPLPDLIYRAQQALRSHFAPNRIQLSSLLSIKTGGCPEDCKYCPQSVHHAAVPATPLLQEEEVLAAARKAKEAGATRFCMGAAWRQPKPKALQKVCNLISKVKAMGLETCATLGMLSQEQAFQLKAAGLDYYNHNLDTDPEYYKEIISTRVYEDRLNTLRHARRAGLRICCGGIVGMGESRRQRAGLIAQLARMEPHPESVPINLLVRVQGTPMAKEPRFQEEIDPFELVRTIAVARITMPASYVRLSAGRQEMSDELQALCILAGANSFFYGEKLLTTDNSDLAKDKALFRRVGLVPEERCLPSSRQIAT